MWVLDMETQSSIRTHSNLQHLPINRHFKKICCVFKVQISPTLRNIFCLSCHIFIMTFKYRFHREWNKSNWRLQRWKIYVYKKDIGKIKIYTYWYLHLWAKKIREFRIFGSSTHVLVRWRWEKSLITGCIFLPVSWWSAKIEIAGSHHQSVIPVYSPFLSNFKQQPPFMKSNLDEKHSGKWFYLSSCNVKRP